MVRRVQVPIEAYRPSGPWVDRPPNTLSRPRTWLKSLVVDWLFLVVSYGIAGLLFWVVKAPRQIFRLGDPELSYPIMPEQLGTEWTLIFSWLVPIVIMLLSWFFLFGRHKRDLLPALTGLLEALAIALLISAIFWKFFGGLRPSFLMQCQPDPSKPYADYTVAGVRQVFYDQSSCTNPDMVNDELHGFPSGHSATAWAGWVFLAMYLSSRSRVWYDGTGRYWKLLFFVLVPLILPAWVAVTRVTDHLHTWYQSIVGALIGVFAALLVYRLRHVDNAWGRDGHITHQMAQKASRRGM